MHICKVQISNHTSSEEYMTDKSSSNKMFCHFGNGQANWNSFPMRKLILICIKVYRRVCGSAHMNVGKVAHVLSRGHTSCVLVLHRRASSHVCVWMCRSVKNKIVRGHAKGSLTLVQLVLPSKELKNNAACVARELDTKEAVI